MQWNMSFWDLIELQMKGRVDRKGLAPPAEKPRLDQLNSSMVATASQYI